MAKTVTKGLMGEEDLSKWDGAGTTFSRTTSTGGAQTLTKVGAGAGWNFSALTLATLVANDFTSPRPNKIYVVDGTTYTTIAAAISAADTAGGGTVLVPRGSYTVSADPFSGITNPIFLVLDKVTINTSVALAPPAGSKIIGSGYGSRINQTTLSAPPRTINILANYVEVAGVRITYDDTNGDLSSSGFGAISVRNPGGYALIHHNILDNVAVCGITLDDVANCVISNNIVLNSREQGIYLGNADENNVHDNVIIDAGQNSVNTAPNGIKCAAGLKNNIHHNYIENPLWAGISLEESSPDTDISHNLVDSNIINYTSANVANGIRISASATGNASIKNNVVLFAGAGANTAAIYIQGNAGKHDISGNRIIISGTNTNQAALRVDATGKCLVTGNVAIADAASVPFAYLIAAGTDHVITNNWALAGTGSFSTGIRTTGTTTAFVGLNNVAATTAYNLASDTTQIGHQTLSTFAQSVDVKRIRANQSTAHVAGDYALGGNWGTTPSVSAVTATDHGGRVTITSGSGTPGANPTLALTFKDGTWTTAPAVSYARGDGNTPSTGFWALTGITATIATWTFVGTPAASTTYRLDFTVLGK